MLDRCDLYYKLHGSARPISMKSDVIRKRSRHDARRGTASETPSASPDISRHASPVPREEASPLAPDSSTQMIFTDYREDLDFRTTQSELLGALGDLSQTHSGLYFNMQTHFPGPYQPDHLSHLHSIPKGSDPLPFGSSP
jgi:GATA-binding protein